MTVNTAPAAEATLITAYTMWQAAPWKDGRTNGQRSQADLLNYRRALELLALGSRGTAELHRVPITELAYEEPVVRERVETGISVLAATGKKAPASKKTVQNLVSNALGIRKALADKLGAAEFRRKSASAIHAAKPKRAVVERLDADQWPTSITDEFEGPFRAYCTEPFYTGPGHEHREKALRERSFAAYKTRISQYVRYCVQVEGIQPTLADLCDVNRLKAFRQWYFKEVPEGGYTAFNQCCVALVKIARYLCATGQKFGEYRPHDKELGRVFYKIGEETLLHGKKTGKTLKNRVAPDDMTPYDLYNLGKRLWNTAPGYKERYSSPATAELARKRTAVFLMLAPFAPMRKRNWLALKWGKSLYFDAKKRVWVVHFEGDELKVDARKGERNVYRVELPQVAADVIEDWRKVLARIVGQDFERTAPYAVLSTRDYGQPASEKAFNAALDAATAEMVGTTFGPHQIRHVVGTYLVNGSKTLEEAQVAADLLGDTLDTVLKTYYRPDHESLRRRYFDAFSAALK